MKKIICLFILTIFTSIHMFGSEYSDQKKWPTKKLQSVVDQKTTEIRKLERKTGTSKRYDQRIQKLENERDAMEDELMDRMGIIAS